jgi:hypothetical protein
MYNNKQHQLKQGVDITNLSSKIAAVTVYGEFPILANILFNY